MKFKLLPFCLISSLSFASTFKLEEYLFTKPDPGMKTVSYILQKNGKIIASRFEESSPNNLNVLWSMSKSVTSLLVGIAQERGYLNLEDNIYKYFKKEIDSLDPKQAKGLKEIRIRHLLQMSSGLDWKEYYEEDAFNSDVVKMLYLKSSDSTGIYALKTPALWEPGTRFLYSSGDTAILTEILRRSLPPEYRDTYPWEWLFEPMGINAVFEQDGAGAFMGSSYLYLKTKDLLKIGQLLIDKGMYKGRQLVPAAYVDFALSLSDSMRKRGCLEDSYMTYGAQFWLNAICPNGKRPFPEVPASLVMLLGHGGQSVFIFPDQKVVAVRISQDKEKAMDKQKYAKLVLEAVSED